MATLAAAVEEACRVQDGRLTALNATLPGLTDRVAEEMCIRDSLGTFYQVFIHLARHSLGIGISIVHDTVQCLYGGNLHIRCV